ncbi:MAG: flavin reductase family protein [Candidatus Neomarinimicrobiota bacterium]
MIENGVFVLTARWENYSFASTVTWVTQTSFKPPLVAIAVKTDSGIYQGVKNSMRFGLHIVGEDQESFAASFFKPSRSDGSTINGHAYGLSPSGIPILRDASAFLECRVTGVVEEGDHHVFVGEVVEAGVRDDSKPLLLRNTRWSYGG